MSLNATQREYLEAVRKGEKKSNDVFKDLEGVEPEAYRNANFRELLFALDSLNILGGRGWTEIFIRKLVRNCDWIESGKLKPKAYIEISDYQDTYGRGEYGIGVVLDLHEVAQELPVNAQSFTRRTIREHFNGIQPINEHALFLVKRYIERKASIEAEDVSLLFHVAEETKGLQNAEAFDRFFAVTIRDHIAPFDNETNSPALHKATRILESCDEITDAEKLLIKELKNRGLSLSSTLLGHIDLSRDQLMGMA